MPSGGAAPTRFRAVRRTGLGCAMFSCFPSPVPVWADARPAPERFARLRRLSLNLAFVGPARHRRGRRFPTASGFGRFPPMGYPLDSGSPSSRCPGLVDPWTPAHCAQNAPWARQTPVCRQLGHEAAFRADRITHAPWPSQAWKRGAIGKPFRGPPMANHSMLWSPESNGYPTSAIRG